MAEFNTYRVYYHTAPQYSWDARIDLYQGGAPVGTLLFMKEGNQIPANSSPGGVPRLHYSIRHFANIMSLIREEKPLHVLLNTMNGIGTLSSTDEPVGEEEG